MNSRYFQNIFYRLLKPKAQNYFNELQKLQQKSRGEILEIQNQKLKNLIAFSYMTSPYYRSKIDELDLADKVKTGRFEINELPILTKHDLRSCGNELLSNSINIKKLLKGQTGGSTGLPVTYYYDQHSLQQTEAALRTFFTWSGWKPGERILFLWGARQDLTNRGVVKKNLGEWVSGRKILPAYEFDEAIMSNWLLIIKTYKPVIIYGYTSILSAFAKYIKESEKGIWPLKGIYTTAEMLYPTQRQLIEEVFHCKTYNQYGCREIPGIASECPNGNMHILTDMAYVEALGGKSTGHRNELIATSLSNWAMPLIRYKLGDLGELKEGACPCGLSFPMMEIGFGRTNDILVTLNGKHIYPSYFIHLLDDFSEIQEYQFRQTRPSQFVLYIREEQANDLLIKNLKSLEVKMKKDFGQGLSLDISVVEKIEKTQAGKHRFIISDLN